MYLVANICLPNVCPFPLPVNVLLPFEAPGRYPLLLSQGDSKPLLRPDCLGGGGGGERVSYFYLFFFLCLSYVNLILRPGKKITEGREGSFSPHACEDRLGPRVAICISKDDASLHKEFTAGLF